MKHLLKIFAGLLFMAFALNSCDKKDTLNMNNNGSAVNLSAAVSTFAPIAADSITKTMVFNWTDPNYASNGPQYSRYIIQIDSATRDFSNAQSVTVIGKLTDSILAKDMNTMLLALGFKFNTPGTAQVRIKSSYNNFNEQYTSNVVTVSMTAYKIPPKIALPTTGRLFLVGDASQGGWGNPVPVPSQEFSQMDETTWAGVFNLNGNAQYLALPLNGDWTHKFSVASSSAPSAGGDFGFDLPSNFNGPSTSGWYVITLSFQTGKYSVVPYTGVLPTNLFLVGDATAGGWNNPVPVPSQQFTRQSSSIFTITVPMSAAHQYLMLPVNGDWSHKYAIANSGVPAAGGSFGYDLPTNFNGPATAGTYTLTANFVTQTYTLQ